MTATDVRVISTGKPTRPDRGSAGHPLPARCRVIPTEWAPPRGPAIPTKLRRPPGSPMSAVPKDFEPPSPPTIWLLMGPTASSGFRTQVSRSEFGEHSPQSPLSPICPGGGPSWTTSVTGSVRYSGAGSPSVLRPTESPPVEIGAWTGMSAWTYSWRRAVFQTQRSKLRWKGRLGVGFVSALREAGDLRILEPGQAIAYENEIRMLDGMEEMDEFRPRWLGSPKEADRRPAIRRAHGICERRGLVREYRSR